MENLNKEIAVFDKQASTLQEQAENLSVTTLEEAENASVFLKNLNDVKKSVENKRLEFTKPLNQSLRAINQSFKGVLEPLGLTMVVVKGKIINWRKNEEIRLAKEEARRQKIQESHKQKGHDVNAPVLLERPNTTIGNAQTRKVWRYKITDFSKVPDTFKGLNTVAVNQAIRDGVREIEGLEIYQDDILAVTGE